MPSKVNFVHSKWPTAAIFQKLNSVLIKKGQKCDGSHFVKNFKKENVCIDLKWPEMRLKVNFGHPIWAPGPGGRFVKIKKKKVWPEMRSKVKKKHLQKIEQC